MRKIVAILLAATLWANVSLAAPQNVITGRHRLIHLSGSGSSNPFCTGYQYYGTTMSCIFNGDVAAGSLILCGMDYESGSMASIAISDSFSDTYSALDAYINYWTTASAAGSNTVSVSWTPTAPGNMICVAVSGYTAIDQHAAHSVWGPGMTANAIVTATVTPAVNNEYIFAWAIDRGAPATYNSIAIGTLLPWQLLGSTSGNEMNVTGEYLVQSTAAAIYGTFTVSGGTGTGADEFDTGIITLHP
jgi:hypothetical protein